MNPMIALDLAVVRHQPSFLETWKEPLIGGFVVVTLLAWVIWWLFTRKD
jgi:hypothetical protein